MKLRKDKSIIINSLPIVTLTLLYCLSFIVDDFGLGTAVFTMLMLALSIFFVAFSCLRERRLFFERSLLPVLLIVAIIILTSLNNLDIHDSTKLHYLLIMIVSVIVLMFTKYSEDTVKAICKIITVTGVIFATLIYLYKFFPALFETYIFPYMTDTAKKAVFFDISQGYSFYVHSDIAYTLTMIIFAFLISIYRDGKPKIITPIYLFGAIFVSQRRTELLFGIIALVITLVLLKSKELIGFIRRHKTIFTIVISIAILALLAVAVFYFTIDESFTSNNRILMTIYDLKFSEDAGNGRGVLYAIAAKLLHENWLIGIGFMNFSKFCGESGNTIARNVHNIYLQSVLECGLVLGVLLIGTLLYVLKKSFNATKESRRAAGFSMVLFLLLGGITSNTLFEPYFWITFCLSLYIVGYTNNKSINIGEKIT